MPQIFSRTVFSLALLVSAAPVIAGAPTSGSITFSPVGAAISVPALGTAVLILLAILLAFIAVLTLKKNGSGTLPSVALLLALGSLASAGGIQWMERASAAGGAFSIVNQGGQTFSVSSGFTSFANNAGVPMRATALMLPNSCPSPTGAPLCTVGLQLQQGESCEIQCFSAVSDSDARLKEDILWVGISHTGLALYEFRYKGRSAVFRGVMAQEVLFHTPSAVHLGGDGYLRVDYARLSLPFIRVR